MSILHRLEYGAVPNTVISGISGVRSRRPLEPVINQIRMGEENVYSFGSGSHPSTHRVPVCRTITVSILVSLGSKINQRTC